MLLPGTRKEVGDLALRSVEKSMKTLIIGAGLRSLSPPFSFICTHKDAVFISETSEYFEAVTSAVDDYKAFILVGFAPNDFEIEFFRQVCSKLHKKIIIVLVSQQR